jgi:hypothetical protein
MPGTDSDPRETIMLIGILLYFHWLNVHACFAVVASTSLFRYFVSPVGRSHSSGAWLLRAGCGVGAVCSANKGAHLAELFVPYGDKFELIVVPDITQVCTRAIRSPRVPADICPWSAGKCI